MCCFMICIKGLKQPMDGRCLLNFSFLNLILYIQSFNVAGVVHNYKWLKLTIGYLFVPSQSVRSIVHIFFSVCLHEGQEVISFSSNYMFTCNHFHSFPSFPLVFFSVMITIKGYDLR